MVSIPRVSTGPAGCRISRDYARRGQLGYRDGSPQLGAPGPGLERPCKHCMQAPGKQRGQSGARVTVQQAAKSTQAKVSLRGGVEPEGAAFERDRVCFFVLCKRHWINRVPGAHQGDSLCVPSGSTLTLAGYAVIPPSPYHHHDWARVPQ